MAFELHVWGPAFGLDSIDAECLAAIAAFRHIFASDEWSLVASNDIFLSPDHTLPALFHGGIWTSGYMNIISYLRQTISPDAKTLADDAFTAQQQADSLAFSSYLTTRGSGLIALSLYASPNAWMQLTRPAYSALLPFPLTWTIPSSLHTAAIEMAENIGMGGIATETEPDEASYANTAETTSTGFLRLRQQLGPMGVMQPEQKAAIRFEQIAAEFFTTFDGMRGPTRYIFGTASPSSLDFLTYGYLALMRVQTPYPILARVLTKSRPSVQLLQTVETEYRDYVLPRREPQPRDLSRTMSIFADGAMENIAGFGDSWKRWRHGGIKHQEESVQDSAQVLITVGGAIAGLAAAGAAVFFKGLPQFGAATHRFEAPRESKGLYRFGDVGAMLDSLPIFD
ncbi:Tom37 C-terminal domain-containing protein [Xylaria nigripes]|nr:Tom37 C-terminal domain-containing protein [Xylaria nigripes]